MVSINFTPFLYFLENFFVQFGAVIAILFVAIKLKSFITQSISNISYNDGYQSNRAGAFSTFGYFVSTILIILSAIPIAPSNYFNDIVSIFSIAGLGVLFLIINRFLFRLIFLHNLNPLYEFNRENTAFAIFQSGNMVALSILFFYSFNGYQFSIGSIVVGGSYFLLSTSILYLFSKIALLKKSYDYIREIQKINIAMAIDGAMVFISLALLFGNSIHNIERLDIVSILFVVLYFTTSSLFLLFVSDFVTSLISTGNKKIDKSIRDGNLVVAIKSGGSKVVLASILIHTFPTNILIYQ